MYESTNSGRPSRLQNIGRARHMDCPRFRGSVERMGDQSSSVNDHISLGKGCFEAAPLHDVDLLALAPVRRTATTGNADEVVVGCESVDDVSPQKPR